MKAEFVNPFLEAAALVYKQMLDVDLIRGKTVIRQSPAPNHEIAIVISVTGQVKGTVVYSLNMDSVEKIVQKLMPGATAEQARNEYKDIMGELSNMMTGNALNIFLKNDSDLDVSVPTVVDTRQKPLELGAQTTLSLNLYSPFGMLEVNVSME
jgi:chemotaxis protein CheX